MGFTFNARGLAAASCFVLVLASASRASELQLRDEFESERPERWQARSGEWQVKNGVLQHTSGGDSLYRARIEPAKDVMVEVRVRLSAGGRETFGVALRVVEDSYLLVRHYDLARALELLSYQNGQWTRTSGRSASLSLKRDTWYRLKLTTVGDHVMAKLWPEDASEPDWQLDVVVSNREPGSLAVVVHDNSQVEFDWVRATDKADVLSRLRAKLARHEAERKAAFAARLSLSAVPESKYCTSSTETRSRTLHVVPHVGYDRYRRQHARCAKCHPVRRQCPRGWLPQASLEAKLPLMMTPP